MVEALRWLRTTALDLHFSHEHLHRKSSISEIQGIFLTEEAGVPGWCLRFLRGS